MPISRTAIRRVPVAIVIAGALVASLSACGFIAAGNKSSTKPSGFVLTGQASVALPAGDAATVGQPCQSPVGATDVAANVVVTVTSATGTKIAAGSLGTGVVTGVGSVLSCSFPFQIPGVPGSEATYNVAVGTRPAQSFAGDALRQSTPADLTITP